MKFWRGGIHGLSMLLASIAGFAEYALTGMVVVSTYSKPRNWELKVIGRHRSYFVVIAWLFGVTGCASAEDKDLGPILYDSEAQLDKADIELFEEGLGYVAGFEGLSGRVIQIITLVADDMQTNHSSECGESPIPNHLFFFKDDGQLTRVISVRRSVPDATNQIREYFDESGEKKIVLPFSRGARILPGCAIEYVFDNETKQLEFRQFHR